MEGGRGEGGGREEGGWRVKGERRREGGGRVKEEKKPWGGNCCFYLHEQSMSVVNWVPQLKGKDSICSTLTELRPEFMGGEAVLVQTIIPVNPLQSLNVSSN